MTIIQMFPGSFFLYAIVLFICSGNLFAASSADRTAKTILYDKAEKEIVSIISLINQQQTDLAIEKVQQLKQNRPNFSLAQLIHSDLLLSRSNNLDNFFSLEKDSTKKNDYIAELDARVDAVTNKLQTVDVIPDNFAYFSADIPYILAFDYSKSRLYLFKNEKIKAQPAKSKLTLVADQYLTIGLKGALKEIDGDKKSPIGVYHITSFIDDNQLPELYGWGAFPINYPNVWDKRLKRTGSGIWLHGVPRSKYSRPPKSSRGCLVVSNDFLQELSSYIGINTPMLLSQSLNWETSTKQQKNKLINHLLDWKKTWQDKNMSKYSSLYADNFNNGRKNRQQWLAHKQKIFSQGAKIKLSLSKISIIHYPDETNLVSVNFQQSYQHGGFRSTGMKQQYWQQNEQGQWQIIDERMER